RRSEASLGPRRVGLPPPPDPFRLPDLHRTHTSYFRARTNGLGDVAVGLTHVFGSASQQTHQCSPCENASGSGGQSRAAPLGLARPANPRRSTSAAEHGTSSIHVPWLIPHGTTISGGIGAGRGTRRPPCGIASRAKV